MLHKKKLLNKHQRITQSLFVGDRCEGENHVNIWDKRIPGKRKSKNKSPKTRLYLGCSRKSKRASGASVEWAKKRMEGVRLSESSSRVSMFSQWPPRVTWTLVLLPYPILHLSFQSLFKCTNKTTSSSSEIHEKKI